MQLQITPVNPQETAHENVVPDLPWSKPRFWRIDDKATASKGIPSLTENATTPGSAEGGLS